MLDKGVSLRCIVMWVSFVTAAVTAALGFILSMDQLGLVAIAATMPGCVFVVLTDNAKTRRLIWRLEAERTSERASERVASIR